MSCMQLDNEILFLWSETPMPNIRPQIIRPTQTTALPTSPKTCFLSNAAPVTSPVGFYILAEFLILLRSPCSFPNVFTRLRKSRHLSNTEEKKEAEEEEEEEAIADTAKWWQVATTVTALWSPFPDCLQWATTRDDPVTTSRYRSTQLSKFTFRWIKVLRQRTERLQAVAEHSRRETKT